MTASDPSAFLTDVDIQIQVENIEQVGPRFVLALAMRFLLYSGYQQ